MNARIPALGALFLILPATVAAAQPSPQWGQMQPGPYVVGFTVIQTVDETRGYWPAVDYRSRRAEHETARPMQLSIWYPSRAPADATRLRFEDYVHTSAGALGPERTTANDSAEAIEALRRGPLNPSFPEGVRDEDLARVLATPTAAVRDGEPAEGRFPIVVHAGFGLIGQSVLNEYLASHGYVVVTYPLLGTSPAWYHRGEGTPAAHQAAADDIGFALARARELGYADPARVALIGMFSSAGLLYQMQNQQLDALAVLDGSYPSTLREVPGYDPDAVRIPILEMPRSGTRDDRTMLDSLVYADRYVVTFDSLTHGDFYQFRRIARPDLADDDVGYHVIARYTRAFLDATLRADPAAADFLAIDPDEAGAPRGFLTIEKRAGLPPTPTGAEFLRLIRDNDVAEARRAWREATAARPGHRLVNEGAMTTTLLFLRRDEGAAGALEGFRLLADMFPGSERAREHLAATVDAANAD